MGELLRGREHGFISTDDRILPRLVHLMLLISHACAKQANAAKKVRHVHLHDEWSVAQKRLLSGIGYWVGAYEHNCHEFSRRGREHAADLPMILLYSNIVQRECKL